jgi:hypothetical protein
MNESFHEIFIRCFKNLVDEQHMSELSAFCEATKITKDFMVKNNTWEEGKSDVFCYAPYIPLMTCFPRSKT